MYYKDVEEFLRGVTFQTAKMFGLIEQEKLANFYEILEKLIVEDILSDSKQLVCYNSTFKHGRNFCTKSVATALIASGISEDGTIPHGVSYEIEPVENNEGIKKWAKRRYGELSRDLQEEFIPNLKAFAMDAMRNNKVDLEKTLVAVFTVDDINLGYIDAPLEPDLEYSIACLVQAERDTLEGEGLKESVCYKILEDTTDVRHYNIVTKRALIAMATIDYDLATGKKVSKERIDTAQTLVRAAKAYDEDTITKYEDLFTARLITSGKLNNKTRKLGGKNNG